MVHHKLFVKVKKNLYVQFLIKLVKITENYKLFRIYILINILIGTGRREAPSIPIPRGRMWILYDYLIN